MVDRQQGSIECAPTRVCVPFFRYVFFVVLFSNGRRLRHAHDRIDGKFQPPTAELPDESN